MQLVNGHLVHYVRSNHIYHDTRQAKSLELITLHINRDLTDYLDLKSCANAFVDKDKHYRLVMFGRFPDENC